jgi:hypothetical protein
MDEKLARRSISSAKVACSEPKAAQLAEAKIAMDLQTNQPASSSVAHPLHWSASDQCEGAR